MDAIAVGDLFRDKYGDTPIKKNLRKIRVVEILPNGHGAIAEVIKNIDGSDLKRTRFTTVSLKTLKNGYEKESV